MSLQTIATSQMIRTHVTNWEGEHLGVIEDVMINKFHGEVSYLVLSYPGEWAVLYPNKRFAVPFDAIARKVTPSGMEVDYILNVTEAFLQSAPGFDNDRWPDFADEKFSSVLKDYFKDVSVDIRV